MLSEKYFNVNNKLPIDPERIVIKVGSAVLSDAQGKLDSKFIEKLALILSKLMDDGKKIILVSSGAVSAGVGAMGWNSRPKTIPEKQAMASIGQGLLMGHYIKAFGSFGKNVSQMLLTRDDMEDRRRYLNARYTLEKLLDWGVLPIINENDTTTIDELRFGDNDLLSAIVATKMNAQLLVILTDVEGLFDSNPKLNKNARLLRNVDRITPEIESLVGEQVSKMGSGGMMSKIFALKYVSIAGLYGILISGRKEGVFEKVFRDNFYGTMFHAIAGRKLTSWKKWIAFGKLSKGREIVVDKGAEKAIKIMQKSLLPVGIVEVRGSFNRGDVISVFSQDEVRIAKGLANYSSEEIRKIAGKKSSEIEKILGAKEYDEVIHKDNLVIL